jgi:dihydroorotase
MNRIGYSEGESFELPMPDDFHVHFRQGGPLASYVRRHAASFGRAMAMPNTLPPVSDSRGIESYRNELLAALPQDSGFQVLMTFKILPGMDRRTVQDCAAAGAVAGKYYPSGATTHAEDGPRSFGQVEEVLKAMEDLDLVLSIHGEAPEASTFDREKAFLPALESLIVRHPRLRIVLEHLSSAEAVSFVAGGPDTLAATITAHHLLFTLDSMMGGNLDPHLFCKPVIKSEKDRRALMAAVFSGSRKFFFGSDSAPHGRAAKEKAKAPGGVYSAPTALPALVSLFEAEGKLDALPGFLSAYGADFYRLPRLPGRLKLVKKEWEVPGEMDGVVPMCANARLPWSFAPDRLESGAH